MFTYKFFAKLVNLGLHVYFRNIYFYNDEVVSLEKPVLLACNHPTAFIEPMLIGSSLKKPVFYLVRADIFRDGIIKYFTDSFGMIPIYRMVDGLSAVKNNEEIFKGLYKKLNEDNIIVVFAEGNTIQEKRLRPIKKGTARLAFGAHEKYGLDDIDIIPTGVNYCYPNKYRKDVMVEFGEPIRMVDYMEAYKENPNRAIVKLTKELQKRMKDFVICIDEKEDEDLVEHLFIMDRSKRDRKTLPIVQASNKELRSEWNIANTINQLEAREKTALKNRTSSYFSQLEKHNIADRPVLKGNTRFGIVNTLLLFVLFIPFIIGIIPIMIPMYFSERLVKAKIKHVEFEAPIRYTVSLGQYLLILIIGLLIALIAWNPYVLGFVIALPFLTWIAATYIDIFIGWNEDRKWVFAAKEVKGELVELRKSVVLDVVEV